ncbi:MAG: HEAT repeat domain-containing protein [Dissulfurispiraceae bacterium]
MDNSELKAMILDYMEKGFLDNIIDMFKHDEGLYPFIIDMIRDERVRVRLGGTALVEELSRLKQRTLVHLIPILASHLTDKNPTIRGDSANLLGIIRHKDALPFLVSAQEDENANVREIVKEAIDEIESPLTMQSLDPLKKTS